MCEEGWGSSINYVRMHLGGGGVKSPIHFHGVLHVKRGEGAQIACKIAYVINGRPLVEGSFLRTGSL